MKITYFYHCGFSVELSRHVLLFDYWQGQLPAWPKGKALTVFVSHKHQDHFQHSIFRLALEYPNITFVLSKDIRMSERYMDRLSIPEVARTRIHYAKKQDSFSLDPELSAETLPSTDEGVAFLVSCEGKTIYHAGDLNWWTWPGEETEAEYQDMTNRFHNAIGHVTGRTIDAAFLTLDGRQGDRYHWGFDAFLQITDTKAAFPMHCFGEYTVFDRLRTESWCDDYRKRIYCMRREGESLELP